MAPRVRAVTDDEDGLEELKEAVGGAFADLIASVKVPDPIPVAPGIEIFCPTKKEVSELLKATTDEQAQKIIFRDNYEAAMALFDPQPVKVWEAFMEQYNAHFFGDKNKGK